MFPIKKAIMFFTLVFLILGAENLTGVHSLDGRLEFSGGVHHYKNENTVFQGDQTSVDYSGVFGIAAEFFFGRIGFAEYLNVFTPIGHDITTPKGIDYSYTNSDYKYAIGIDNVLGFVCKVVELKYITLPVAIGIHLMSSTYTLNQDAAIWTMASLGVGFNVSLEFHPVSKFYVFFRMHGAYDFYGRLKQTADDMPDIADSGKIKLLLVSPLIGVGFSF